MNTWTGEVGGEEDVNVLKPAGAIEVIKVVTELLTTEKRITTACHKDVARFLRTVLPEKCLVIRETDYY